MNFDSPTYMEDSCIDINECDPDNIKHLCHKYAECTNTDGGYYCECQYGWTGDGYKGQRSPIRLKSQTKRP